MRLVGQHPTHCVKPLQSCNTVTVSTERERRHSLPNQNLSELWMRNYGCGIMVATAHVVVSMLCEGGVIQQTSRRHINPTLRARRVVRGASKSYPILFEASCSRDSAMTTRLYESSEAACDGESKTFYIRDIGPTRALLAHTKTAL